MTHSIHCSVCGNTLISSESISIPSVDRDPISYSYVLCKKCSTYNRDFSLTKTQEELLYSEGYDGFCDTGFVSRLKHIHSHIKAFSFRRYISQKRVLEIGCATGEFLAACKKYNPTKLTGNELSSYAAQHARDIHRLDIIESSFESFESKNQYDTIFLFHVIEHLDNPPSSLSAINTLLASNGHLILETPNWKSFEKMVFGDTWRDWSAPHHSCVFSTSSLVSILETCDFEIASVSFSKHPYPWYKNMMNVFYLSRLRSPLSLFLFVLTIPFLPFLGLFGLPLKRGGRVQVIARKK